MNKEIIEEVAKLMSGVDGEIKLNMQNGEVMIENIGTMEAQFGLLAAGIFKVAVENGVSPGTFTDMLREYFRDVVGM